MPLLLTSSSILKYQFLMCLFLVMMMARELTISFSVKMFWTFLRVRKGLLSFLAILLKMEWLPDLVEYILHKFWGEDKMGTFSSAEMLMY